MNESIQWAIGDTCLRRIDDSLFRASIVDISSTANIMYEDGTCENEVELSEIENVPMTLLKVSFNPSTAPSSSSKCDMSFYERQKTLNGSFILRRRATLATMTVQRNDSSSKIRAMPAPDLLPLAALCLICKKHTIYRCMACNGAFYCSRLCQTRHHPIHKHTCSARPFRPLFRTKPPNVAGREWPVEYSPPRNVAIASPVTPPPSTFSHPLSGAVHLAPKSLTRTGTGTLELVEHVHIAPGVRGVALFDSDTVWDNSPDPYKTQPGSSPPMCGSWPGGLSVDYGLPLGEGNNGAPFPTSPVTSPPNSPCRTSSPIGPFCIEDDSDYKSDYIRLNAELSHALPIAISPHTDHYPPLCSPRMNAYASPSAMWGNGGNARSEVSWLDCGDEQGVYDSLEGDGDLQRAILDSLK